MLIAALLELKSRLMLPGEEVEELDELAPAEAAEELLERMLRYARFRGAAGWLRERRATARRCSTARRRCPRAAPASVEQAEASYDPAVLGAALGGLLRTPPPMDLSHMAMPRVSLGERLAHLRGCCGGGGSRSTRRSGSRPDDGGGDAVRAARALQARRGDWEQDEPFGPITVAAT